MWNPFKRGVREICITSGTIHHEHKFNVRYEPKPRPVLIYGEITNMNGELWRLPPININGQFLMPIQFPLVFMTGRPEDNGKQVQVQFRLEY